MTEDIEEFDYTHRWELEREGLLQVRAEQKETAEFEKQIFYKSIGQVIQKYRILKGLSRNALAQKIGLNENDIYQYEDGRKHISLQRFMKICIVLDVDFRFTHHFHLEAEEYDLINAYRNRDYKSILEHLAQEV